MVCLLALSGCAQAGETIPPEPTPRLPDPPAQTDTTPEPSDPVQLPPQEPEPEPVETPAEPEPEPYQSPLDFASLQAENPHIYGWIRIPGMHVDYPLVQHPEDDTFYLNHNSEGRYYIGGALFTEHRYNGTAFTDPVTVVYGHRMSTTAMFGKMQSTYSNPNGMAEHSEVLIYLPDKELHFKVFAAIPYDNRHILYNYNFESKRMYNAFLDSVRSVREIGAVWDNAVAVTPEDQLLVLSTCLQGNSQKRFLVIAKCMEAIPAMGSN